MSRVIIIHVFPPDYLDNGNNKMAIQQADKLLKKHKDLHCAKVGEEGIIFPAFIIMIVRFCCITTV